MPTVQLTGGAVTETLKKCDVVVKEATYAEPSTEGGIDVERKAGGLYHSFPLRRKTKQPIITVLVLTILWCAHSFAYRWLLGEICCRARW